MWRSRSQYWHPYMSLKGETKRGHLGRACSLKWARGRSFAQSKCSCDSLTRVVFREQLVLSTLPEDWGWYGIWKCQVMSRALDRIWEVWEVNSGPLSHWREAETPNWGCSLGRGALRMCQSKLGGTWHIWHVGKDKLPVSSRKGTLGLMCRKMGATIPEVEVWHLTDFGRGSDGF